MGSRSGVARCGGPWSGSSSPDRGFNCCVRPALAAALYPLLWSICIYAPVLCNPMEPSVGIICLVLLCHNAIGLQVVGALTDSMDIARGILRARR